MPVIVKFGDITKYKGTAIVNSLGSRYEIPGLICQNILKKVNNDNILGWADLSWSPLPSRKGSFSVQEVETGQRIVA